MILRSPNAIAFKSTNYPHLSRFFTAAPDLQNGFPATPSKSPLADVTRLPEFSGHLEDESQRFIREMKDISRNNPKSFLVQHLHDEDNTLPIFRISLLSSKLDDFLLTMINETNGISYEISRFDAESTTLKVGTSSEDTISICQTLQMTGGKLFVGNQIYFIGDYPVLAQMMLATDTNLSQYNSALQLTLAVAHKLNSLGYGDFAIYNYLRGEKYELTIGNKTTVRYAHTLSEEPYPLERRKDGSFKLPESSPAPIFDPHVTQYPRLISSDRRLQIRANSESISVDNKMYFGEMLYCGIEPFTATPLPDDLCRLYLLQRAA